MDYFQNVVVDFLRTHRSTFVNDECCIQLDPGEALKGRHWYCDAIAANFQNRTVYLCEVTYSKSLQALITRLGAWNKVWDEIRGAIIRDCSIPDDWSVRPWLFVPHELLDKLRQRLTAVGIAPNASCPMPYPKIKALEDVVPWKPANWDRRYTAGDANDA